MRLVRTNKKIAICNIETIEQLEVYFATFDSDFKRIVDVRSSTELLQHDVIGKKALHKWYRKFIGGIRTKYALLYWTRRGHSDDDAINYIAKLQSSNGKTRHKKIAMLRASGDHNWKKEFTMMPEYYLSRGMTLTDAKNAVHERQTTFSLQKCILRYGEIEGTRVWSQRQEKWLNTLAFKSDAEKQDILRRKVVPMGRASRESLSVFVPLHKMLIEHMICSDSDVYYGYEKRNEWFLADSENFFLYDFCVPKLKLIIEYQGKVWHPDHRLDDKKLSLWKNPHGVTALSVKTNDDKKRAFAERHGYRVVYLWGTDDASINMRTAFDAITLAVNNSTLTVPISSVNKLMNCSSVSVSSPVGFSNVTEFYVKNDKSLYDMLLIDGRRLRCSDDHYVRLSTGQWASIHDLVAARDITYSSIMINTDMGPRQVLSVTYVGVGTVNDMTVEHPEHSYYANGIVSHNTGKTLLAIGAALEQLNGLGNPSRARYDKLIVTRPVQPVGKDIGFLPGTLEEKMEPWIAPIRDNINFLMGSKKGSARRKPNDPNKQRVGDEYYLSIMQDKGLIEIEAITFIRGRSIPNAFIIIDEAQNLSMHELKTIITRVGDGTKIVLTGDIEQIDNIHVDQFTNGLTYAVERFKDYSIAGHVTLVKGERSALATLASQIL